MAGIRDRRYDQNVKLYGDEFNNLFSMMSVMTNEFSRLNKSFDSFSKSYNNHNNSPSHVIVDSINGNNTLAMPSANGNGLFNQRTVSANLLPDDRKFIKTMFVSLEGVMKGINKSMDKIDDSVDDIESNTDSIRNSSALGAGGRSGSNLGVILKSLGAAAGSVLGKLVNDATHRAISDTEAMRAARNDIMYQYGLTDYKKADEIYKMRFKHQAAPYQRRTAPEQRRFERENRLSAIDMGYNTEKSVKAVTKELNKWKDIFENINFESSELFRTTMRFMDTSGKTFDSIMTTVQTTAKNYIVTPELLEEVSSSYAKYLRVVSKSNTAYTKSMNNLIKSVAKLEDAGVNSTKFLDSLQSYQYMDLSNASSSGMWSRFSTLGIDPYKAMTMDQNQLLNEYTKGLQKYFSAYDLSKGQDRMMVNTLAQQVLGFSSGEMQELYDLLIAKPSEGALASESGKNGGQLDYSSQLTTINDYLAKIQVDMEQYYDEATAQWTYLTPEQEAQDKITLEILDSPFVDWYDKFEEQTKGFVDLEASVDTLTTFVTGGGLASLLGGVGSLLGGLFRRGGGATAGGGLFSRLFGKKGATAAAGEAAGTGGLLGGLANIGTALGSGATTTGGLAAAGGASILGAILGAVGIGKGGLDIYQGIKGQDLKGNKLNDYQKKDKFWSGGTALGMVGTGAGVGAAIGSVVPVVGTGVGALVGAGVGGLGALLGSTKAGEALHAAWEDFTKEGGLLDQIKSKSSDVWDDVKGFGIDAFNGIVGVGDSVLSSLFGETYKEDAKKFWGDVKKNASDTWGDIKSKASDAWSNIKSEASTAFNFMKEKASTKVEEIKTSLNTIKDSIDAWYENSNLKKAVDAVKEDLSNKWETTKTNVSNWWNNTKSNISKGWESSKARGESITGIKRHASGLNYVPYDNYLTYLHKGERVLTANDNLAYSQYGNNNINQMMKDSLESIRNSDELVEYNNDYLSGINDQFKNNVSNNMAYKLVSLTNTDQTLNKSTNENSDVVKNNTSIIGKLSQKFDDLKESLSNLGSGLGGSSNTLSTSGGSLAQQAASIISQYEGAYDTIETNDNGALSIGQIQWHGDAAYDLMKDIYNRDPSSFASIANKYGATSLLNDVKSGTAKWTNKKLTKGSGEYNAIKEILGTSAGRSAQDNLQLAYIESYFEKGKSYGLTDPAALIYFADFANQYGPSSSLLKTVTKEALKNGGTLDAMFSATKKHTSSYLKRRESVYNNLKNMSFSGSSASGVSAARQKIIDFAHSKLGTPYVWGAVGPTYYDCSGFVSAALNNAGFNVGRITTANMRNNVTKVSSVNDLTPGDILMGNSGKHTGIYVGDGIVIHSSGGSKNTVSNPGKGVIKANWNSGWYGKWNGLGTYAVGGIISNPTLAMMGEGGYKEYVISTDPMLASKSSVLLSQAASDIGVAGLSNRYSPQSVRVYINTDEVVDAVEELSKIVKRGFEIIQSMYSEDNYVQEVTPSANLITNYA